MIATIGVVLLSAFLLANRWAYNHFRRPCPPAWTKQAIYSQPLIGIILLAMFGGVSFVAFFLGHYAELGFSMLDGIAAAVVTVATIYLYRRLRSQWRAFQAEAPVTSPVIANDLGSDSGTPIKPGAGSGRRAA